MGRLVSSGRIRAPGSCPEDPCSGSHGFRATQSTALEHPGGYLEEEEERGGSLRLGVIAQGYGRLVGGGDTQ